MPKDDKVFVSLSMDNLVYVCVVMFSLGSVRSDLNITTLNYFWPFSNKTVAFELVRNIEAERPKRTSCPVLAVGPMELGYNVFRFDADDQNYAEVKTKSSNLWDDLGLVFIISPEAETGVILQFEANDLKTDTITSYTIELLGGRLQVTMCSDDGSSVAAGLTTRAVQLWRWTMVAVSRLRSTGELVLQIDKAVQSFPALNNKSRPFNSNGELLVSRPPAGSKSKYLGSFCCLAIFSAAIDPRTDLFQVLSAFQENRWPNPAPNVKANCSVTSPYTGPTVLKLWPLSVFVNNSYSGYDVIQGVKPVAPEDYMCLRSKERFEPVHSPAAYFDGSVVSYLWVELSDQSLNSDVTIAMFVKPDSPPEGVLWDYKSSTLEPDGVTGIAMSLTNGLLKLDMRNSRGPCCLLTSQKVVTPNTWSLVYVVLLISTNVVTVFVNDTSTSKAMTCGRGSATATTGIISIGQGQDVTLTAGSYRGSAACLTIAQGELVNTTAQNSLKERCVTLNKLRGARLNCTDGTSPKMRRFRMASDNSRPEVGMAPIGNYTTRSLLECAKLCSAGELCKSLTYRSGTTLNCQHYDYVTKLGLVTDPGNKYYTITKN